MALNQSNSSSVHSASIDHPEADLKNGVKTCAKILSIHVQIRADATDVSPTANGLTVLMHHLRVHRKLKASGGNSHHTLRFR